MCILKTKIITGTNPGYRVRQKIKILKKWKNSQIDYHFTHVYHKWQSYNVWFLRYGAQQTEFFLILEHFLPFYPTNNPKKQNFEKIKRLEILSFYKIVPKIMIISYTAPEKWHVTDVIFIFHFRLAFGSFTSLTAWKIKKMPGDINCIPKIMIRWCTIPEICCAHWKNGWTDKQKKWHIELGTHLKIRQSNSFKTLKKRSMTIIIFFSRNKVYYLKI